MSLCNKDRRTVLFRGIVIYIPCDSYARENTIILIHSRQPERLLLCSRADVRQKNYFASRIACFIYPRIYINRLHVACNAGPLKSLLGGNLNHQTLHRADTVAQTVASAA